MSTPRPNLPRVPKGPKPEGGRPESTLRTESSFSNASRMDMPGLDDNFSRVTSPSRNGFDDRMASPSEESTMGRTTTSPLQMAGRGSPHEEHGLHRAGTEGFHHRKGGARAVNTPVAPLHVDKRYFPKDMRGMLEIYEQGSILQADMKIHTKETTDAIDSLIGHCEGKVQMMTMELHRILLEVQAQVEKPANVDWTPVVDSLRKIDHLQPAAIGEEVTRRLQAHEEAMSQVESRMEEKLAAKIQDIESSAKEREKVQCQEMELLRKEVRKAQGCSTDTTDAVKQIESQLVGTLADQNRALKADFSQALQDILRLQEKNRRADMEKVEPILEAQCKRLLGEHHQTLEMQVASKVEQVLRNQQQQNEHMGKAMVWHINNSLAQQFETSRNSDSEYSQKIGDIHRIIHDDVSQMFTEIGAIQKAMNLAYICTPPRHSVSSSTAENRRVRDIMTQTEQHKKDESIQCDEAYFKSLRRKEKQKTESTVASSRSKVKHLQVAQTADQAAASKGKLLRVKSGWTQYEQKRAKLKEDLVKPQYNVINYYHDTGIAQCIAKSQLFEQVTFVMVFLNTIWIAVESDNNDAVVVVDAHIVFQVVEHFFCAYFAGEIAIRFAAFSEKMRCLRDGPFVFDLVLACCMIIETWVLTVVVVAMGPGQDGNYASGLGHISSLRVLRVAKITRMARMVRLLREVPEVVVIVRSVGVAFRSVFFFLVLMLVLIYVFAVFFRQATHGTATGDRYFSSVPEAMNTLLLDGVLPLYAPFVRGISDSEPIFWPIVMIFITLASITLMNMLIGVLVEGVRTVADREREAMSVIHVTNELRQVMHRFSEDHLKRDSESGGGDKTSRLSRTQTSFLGIRRSVRQNEQEYLRLQTADFPSMSRDIFEQFITYPPVVNLLRECGVDASGIFDSVDLIFTDKVRNPSEGLSFIDFIDIVLNARMTNVATLKDVKEQLRLMRVACDNIGKATGNAVVTHLAQFQSDIASQLKDIKWRIQNIDSDSEDERMHGLDEYSGRVGGLGFPARLPFVHNTNSSVSSSSTISTEGVPVEDYKMLSQQIVELAEDGGHRDPVQNAEREWNPTDSMITHVVTES